MRPAAVSHNPPRVDSTTPVESSAASSAYLPAGNANAAEDFNSKLAQANQTTAPQTTSPPAVTASGAEARLPETKAADAPAPRSASTAAPAVGASGNGSDPRQRAAAAAAAAANLGAADATATDVESGTVAIVASDTAEPATRSGARRLSIMPVLAAALGSGASLHGPATGARALSVAVGTATGEPADLDATQSNPVVTADASEGGSDSDSGGSDAAQLASLLPMLCGVPSQAPPATAGVAATGNDGVNDVGSANATLRLAVDAQLVAVANSVGASDRTGLGAEASSATASTPASDDRSPDMLAAGSITPLVSFDTLQSAARVTSAGTAVTPQIHAPVGSAQWPDELASQLTLMTQHGIQSAELKLTPAHLGPLQIQIDVQNGVASVWFHAGDAHTRAALEQSLPRLRELFAAQGLALSDAGVHREPPRPTPSAQTATLGSSAITPSTAATSSVANVVRLGLIDAYA